jgi:hypothetical protein
MIEVIGDVIGIVIAGGIIYAAKEIKRLADSVSNLDHRVRRLEYWLHRQGFLDDPGRPGDRGPAQGRGDSRSS